MPALSQTIDEKYQKLFVLFGKEIEIVGKVRLYVNIVITLYFIRTHSIGTQFRYAIISKKTARISSASDDKLKEVFTKCSTTIILIASNL